MIRGRIGWPILFGTWLLAGCAPAYVSEPAAQLEPADIAMSTRGYADMLDKFSEYSDAAVQRYVRTVGARADGRGPGPREWVGNHIPANVPVENGLFYFQYLKDNWRRGV